MLKRLLLDRWLRPAPPPAPEPRPAAPARDGVPVEAARQLELGQTLQSAGRLEEALASYARAIELKHDYVDALNAQAVAYLNLGRLEEAEDAFNLAVAFDPASAGAFFGLGLIASERAADEDARSCFQRAAELDPALVPAHARLGTLAYSRDRFEEATAHFQRAVQLQSELPELQSNLGLALTRTGRHEEAIAHLRRAIELRPDFAEAHFNLGAACREAGRLEDALASYRDACAVRPGYAEACNGLGNVHRDLGAFEEALGCYRQALAADPAYAEAQYNAGVALHYQEHTAEAIVAYERACVMKPGYLEARFNLALAHLTAGDLARGWEGYDLRFEHPQEENRVNVGRFPYPLWKGEALAGRSILVWGEQGIGDELFFAGLYAEIAQAAGGCVIECAPKLAPLFARSFPPAAVVPRTDPLHPATQGAFDFHVPAGSLPRYLRPDLERFPARRGYLVPDPGRVAYWRAWLAALGPGLKVGFCWRSTNVKGDRALACTRIEQWQPILSTPGAVFVSLQYDECAAELALGRERSGAQLHVCPGVDLFNDLDEVAAIMSALDLVISAPTAVAVLAGAVGVETWQMNYGPDWQLLGGRRSPWFPGMTQYRRAWNQAWEEIIDEIANDLRRATSARPGLPPRDTSRAADPDGAAAAMAAGAARYEQGDFEGAEAAWRQVVDTHPDNVAARANLGLASYQLGRLDEAVAHERDALARDPGNADAHLNLALALLARGDFPEGWTEYEWRFDPAVAEERARTFPFPRWQGEDLAGKTVLVWKEQSVGGQLVYAGMFQELIERCGFCIIECTPKLVPLFARSFPEADVVPRTEPAHPYTQHGIDFQIPAASLGARLRPALVSFPRHQGYLRADTERVGHWRERLRLLGAGPKIGFSWRSINQSGVRALACAALEQWGPILRAPGVHFVSLQYDDCAQELEAARGRFGVPLHRFDDLDLFNDVDGAAAMTAALDLVISAPTAVTDLSAALGVPTWQLHHGTDWKIHGAGYHPWFPAMRRFQCGLHQPWPELIEEIAAELRRWAAGR
jgi:tetratricopeptide (TPR) repeat protein